MRKLHALAILVIFIAAAALTAAAVDGWELTRGDVRNAYFLGQRRGDQQLQQFLSSYEQRLSAAPGGFHVWSVGISTPYHQVVERSRQSLSYSSQQAQRDYEMHGDRVLATATVYLPQGRVYTFGSERVWNEFDLRLVQSGRTIQPHQIQRVPVYSHDSDGTLVGFFLRAEFSTHQVSRAPVSVEVITHEKQTVTAQFDLARLK